MKLTFWGTRGSIATPGPATVRYGGNTTCLEVSLADGERIILDAGTGIRRLGETLMESGEDRPIHLFLTHSHWDHIQGFPFFSPAYDENQTIRVYGFHKAYDKLREILTNQMESKFFPVDFSDLKANIEFVTTRDEAYQIGGATISAVENNHPGTSHGFRITEGNRSLAFLTDNELDPPGTAATSWAQFVKFATDSNVLIHDAMYTDEELEARRGYGHSSYLQTLNLAAESGTESCLLFHHDPRHDDEMIDRIVEECRGRIARDKLSFRCQAAEESSTIDI